MPQSQTPQLPEGIHATHESINKFPTLFGIERKTCWVAMSVSFECGNLLHSFWLGCLFFGIFWIAAFRVFQKDDRLFRIIWRTKSQKASYCPFKTT